MYIVIKCLSPGKFINIRFATKLGRVDIIWFLHLGILCVHRFLLPFGVKSVTVFYRVKQLQCPSQNLTCGCRDRNTARATLGNSSALLAFPQASLESRTVGFPESGFDVSSSSHFPDKGLSPVFHKTSPPSCIDQQ